MAKTDPQVGFSIHEYLVRKDLENPVIFSNFTGLSGATKNLEKSLTTFCEDLGLDLGDPSVQDTPHRLAKMYKNEICWGLDYNNFPHAMTTPNTAELDEIVLVKDIEVRSLCEHHFMPVIGHAHVAYIPDEFLLGLSKFNRIVEFFARRPQLQERLGAQILETLKLVLDTDDVAVIIHADHYCVKFRGIEDQCSSTVTSHMSGRFRDSGTVRQELLSLINMKKGG